MRKLLTGARIVFGIAASSAWLPLASQAPQSPPKNIFGTYGRLSHGDSIRVSTRGSGKIHVALKLYYANGHTCQLDKEGNWQGDRVVIMADGLDEKEPCRLETFFRSGRILVKDVGRRCAPVYCGTRGKLDGVSLPKASNKE